MQYKIEPVAVDSVLISCDVEITPDNLILLGLLAEHLCQSWQQGSPSSSSIRNTHASHRDNSLKDIIPAYNTLLVNYDVLQIDVNECIKRLHHLIDGFETQTTLQGQRQHKLVEIPVCYDPCFALDIDKLGEQLALTTDEIVHLHSERQYTVMALGFSPGFGYLGALNEQLKVPRLATPRTKVPKGSVAIAELNTAVYPQESPGGWWLIGRSPVPIFDKNREQPALYKVGDQVKFSPISIDEFYRLEQRL